VCDLETSRIGAPYVYDISNLRVNRLNQNLYFAIHLNYIKISVPISARLQ